MIIKMRMVIGLRNLCLKLMLLISCVSCVTQADYEKVEEERQGLSRKVDSLQQLLNEFTVLTVLDNHDFSVRPGEKYSVESMAVLRKGLMLDSLFINGNYVEPIDSNIAVNQGLFGSRIEFTSDTVGEFDIRAMVTSFAWGRKKVKTEWTLFVKD